MQGCASYVVCLFAVQNLLHCSQLHIFAITISKTQQWALTQVHAQHIIIFACRNSWPVVLLRIYISDGGKTGGGAGGGYVPPTEGGIKLWTATLLKIAG